MSYFPYTDHLNKVYLNSLSEALDFYLKHGNICILGDFNAASLNPRLALFLENQNLKNIKNPACFKSSIDSAIDLILTSNNCLYQKS